MNERELNILVVATVILATALVLFSFGRLFKKKDGFNPTAKIPIAPKTYGHKMLVPVTDLEDVGLLTDTMTEIRSNLPMIVNNRYTSVEHEKKKKVISSIIAGLIEKKSIKKVINEEEKLWIDQFIVVNGKIVKKSS